MYGIKYKYIMYAEKNILLSTDRYQTLLTLTLSLTQLSMAE